MTLTHLLFAVFSFFVLLVAAKILDTYFDGSLWIGAVFLAVLISLGVMLRRFARQNMFPKCRNGTCRPCDYESVPLYSDDAGLTFKCKCGQRYLLKRNRFLFVDDDGQTTPYKIRHHFYSRWTDDTDNCKQP